MGKCPASGEPVKAFGNGKGRCPICGRLFRSLIGGTKNPRLPVHDER